jgi:hypothetical protein
MVGEIVFTVMLIVVAVVVAAVVDYADDTPPEQW